MRYERRRRGGHWRVLLISFGIVLLLGTVLFLLGMYLTSDRDTTDEESPNDTVAEEQADSDNVEDPITDQDREESQEDAFEEDVPSEETTGEEAQTPPEQTPPEEEESETEPEEVTEDQAEESSDADGEPIEIVRPEQEDIPDFVPEGGRFVRYWWSNMNEDEYDEVLIGYILDGAVQMMVVGVEDDTVGYSTLWDVALPGAAIESLRSQRVGEGFVIAAITGTAAKQLSLYTYDDEAPELIAFSGGKAAESGGVIAYQNNAATLETNAIAEAVYEAGRVDVYYGPAVGSVDSGNYTLNQDIYQLNDGQFVFQSTTTATYEDGVRQ